MRGRAHLQREAQRCLEDHAVRAAVARVALAIRLRL